MAEYIRGIIFFLIFVLFVGIILPEGKYKNYMNLVLGFVVMAMVFSPLSDIGGMVETISAEFWQPIELYSGTHEETYQSMIADAVRAQMREQLSRAVEVFDYRLLDLDADINTQSGEIMSITMTLTQPESSSDINIAPITISAAGDGSADDIKKIVSDFYQLPEEHIHVIILR